MKMGYNWNNDGNEHNDISYSSLNSYFEMCGCFAGQFSRDNRRTLYMQWTDIHCILCSFLNPCDLTLVSLACICFGGEAFVFLSGLPSYGNLRAGLRRIHWLQHEEIARSYSIR